MANSNRLIKTPLELLYKYLDDFYQDTSKKISTDASRNLALRYNYLLHARQEIIKLLVLEAVINDSPGDLVGDYVDPNNYVISAPKQKEDILKFIDEVIELSKTTSDMEEIKKRLQNDFKQFSMDLNAHGYFDQRKLGLILNLVSENLVISKDPDEIVLLRNIKLQINSSILGHDELRSDAQRDLERNKDFQFGHTITKKIDEMIKAGFDADNLKELHTLLHQTLLKINSSIKHTSEILKKADQPEYKALVNLTNVIKNSISQLEAFQPTLKLEKGEIRKMGKEAALKTKAEIKQTREENKPLQELQKLRTNLTKKLSKNKSSHKDELLKQINAAFNVHEPNASEKTQQIFQKLIEVLEKVDTPQAKKRFSLQLFKRKSPDQEMAAIVKNGLERLEKINKRFAIMPERQKVQLP